MSFDHPLLSVYIHSGHANSRGLVDLLCRALATAARELFDFEVDKRERGPISSTPLLRKRPLPIPINSFSQMRRDIYAEGREINIYIGKIIYSRERPGGARARRAG